MPWLPIPEEYLRETVSDVREQARHIIAMRRSRRLHDSAPTMPPPISIEAKIIRMSAKAFGADERMVCSNNKAHINVDARRAAMYVIRMRTGKSFMAISRIFNFSEHMGVVRTIQRAERLLEDEPFHGVSVAIRSIQKKLKEEGI